MRDRAKQRMVVVFGVMLAGAMFARLSRAALEFLLAGAWPCGRIVDTAAAAPPVKGPRMRLPDAAFARLSQRASAATDVDAPCAELTLVGVVRTASPQGSLAMLRLPDGHSVLLRPGASARGLTLLELQADAVLLGRGEDVVCTAHAYPRAHPDPHPRGASENDFAIDRALRDRVLEAPLMFLGGARVAYVPSGGFSVRGIRPGDLLDRLGVRNGDEVVSVNGMELTLPNGLEAWARLRTADHLAVHIRRAGQSMQLDVAVR